MQHFKEIMIKKIHMSSPPHHFFDFVSAICFIGLLNTTIPVYVQSVLWSSF